MLNRNLRLWTRSTIEPLVRYGSFVVEYASLSVGICITVKVLDVSERERGKVDGCHGDSDDLSCVVYDQMFVHPPSDTSMRTKNYLSSTACQRVRDEARELGLEDPYWPGTMV